MRFTLFYEAATAADVSRTVSQIQQMGRQPFAAEHTWLANTIRGQYRQMFASEGPGWAQLAPSTVRQRIALGFGGSHPILQRTGKYRRSWTDRNSPDHVDELSDIPGGWALTVGSSDYRAIFHERGTSRMPAREVRVRLNRGPVDAVVEKIFDTRWMEAV